MRGWIAEGLRRVADSLDPKGPTYFTHIDVSPLECGSMATAHLERMRRDMTFSGR